MLLFGAIVVVSVVLAGIRFTRRGNDIGWMSEKWLAEYRASQLSPGCGLTPCAGTRPFDLSGPLSAGPPQGEVRPLWTT